MPWYGLGSTITVARCITAIMFPSVPVVSIPTITMVSGGRMRAPAEMGTRA